MIRRLLLLGFALPLFAATPPPNLIVFLADDMGMGDTSAYQDWSGNPDGKQIHTPNMERLARQGIRFTDAHAPSSRCTPSRYAFMTGRYCWRTHLKHWVLFGTHCDPLIEPERTTLPEFLQQAGYDTGMVGKWHLGVTYRNREGMAADGWDDADLRQPMANTPVDHGFDFFYGITRSHPTSGPNGVKGAARNQPDQTKGPGWIRNRTILGATDDGKQLKEGSYVLNEIGGVLHREAIEYLDRTGQAEKPFFLYFASHANHTPYTPVNELAGVKIAGASRFKNGKGTDSVRLDFVHENDVQLGLLLDWLEATEDGRRPGHKLIENTLVIFTSDNGSESRAKTATGPLRSRKGSIFEGGHRVPFIAAWPVGGIPAGADTTSLLSLTDLYATMGAILERPLPNALAAEDSFSQLAALLGKGTLRPSPIFSNDHQEASKQLSDERAWVSVRSNKTPVAGQWKLFLDHRFAFGGELHPQALYELGADQMEAVNRLDDLAAKPALTYLLEQARLAAGDAGRTRSE